MCEKSHLLSTTRVQQMAFHTHSVRSLGYRTISQRHVMAACWRNMFGARVSMAFLPKIAKRHVPPHACGGTCMRRTCAHKLVARKQARKRPHPPKPAFALVFLVSAGR